MRETTIPTVIVTIPTNTLAPLYTFTPKFTATPIPSSTPIPSETPQVTPTTPPAAIPTQQPTLTPTAVILGSVNFTSPTANLRSGPGQSFPVVTGVKAGTRVIVLGLNDTKDWYNVRLEDGSREGWLSAPLVTVGSTTIPVLSTADFDQRTKEALQPTVAAAGTTNPDALPTPRKSPLRLRTDVLAYCDSKTNGEPRKTFTADTPVTVYWSWFAKTPEQLADHISYADYVVTVDGKPLTNWRTYQSNVVRQADGNYYVFWFVPVGTPAAGEHKIDYKLTWKQKITDGFGTFGPGGDEESNTGTCVFTVK